MAALRREANSPLDNPRRFWLSPLFRRMTGTGGRRTAPDRPNWHNRGIETSGHRNIRCIETLGNSASEHLILDRDGNGCGYSYPLLPCSNYWTGSIRLPFRRNPRSSGATFDRRHRGLGTGGLCERVNSGVTPAKSFAILIEG
jgi:hypothetical protein